MAGVQFMDVQGRRVLHLDLALCDLEGLQKVIEAAKVLIVKEAPGSVLTLTNVAGTHVNSLMTRVLKEFTVHNKPFVRAGAVIGLDKLRRIEFNAVVKFSGRNLHAFDTIEQAKEWLAKQ